MKKSAPIRFRMKLFFVLIAFALLISFMTATVSHLQLREQVVKDHEQKIESIEETVAYALNTIEKAYYYFDDQTTEEMELLTKELIALYEEKPNFSEWDFQQLKNKFQMDIYIINDDNVVTHSSFHEDIGLDFSECCEKLAHTLIERREAGRFYVDGLDIEQKTGQLKKYSYMATRDKRFLIQLGLSLEEGTIFQEFNFLDVIADLNEKYPSINEINVLNLGGYSLGKPVTAAALSKERRAAFESALQSQQVIELTSTWQNEKANYRFIPYTSKFDTGVTKNKVLEIVYNEVELQAVLKKTQTFFIIQLVLILVITLLISSRVSRWVSRPMFLAYHDSLTGLKNRTAFDEMASDDLLQSDGMTALLMVDLDNFKVINDQLGHDRGDEILKETAKSFRAFTNEDEAVFRIGGDEFIIIMKATTQTEVKKRVERFIQALNESYEQTNQMVHPPLSVSIGIAFSSEHETNTHELYKKADTALYVAKQTGKNRFSIFEEKDKD